MARRQLLPRVRKRTPRTARLTLEPLEDRALPSAMALIPQLIHFSALAVQGLDAFLSNTSIQTRDVARVTAAELDFFTRLESSRFSGADRGLVDSILTKLHYIDSQPQISLAYAVGLRTDIDAFLHDQPQLGPGLDTLLKPLPAPPVALPLASAIENTLGATPAGGSVSEQEVPFTFFVDLVRAARNITNDLFTNLDLLWASREFLSPGESVLFTAPVNGQLLVQLPPTSSDADKNLAVFIAAGEPVEATQEGKTDADGFQLEVPVAEGATYVLRADLGDGKGHYNFTLALVFGGPTLDSITGLAAREPDVAAVPGFQPTTFSSPGLAQDIAVRLIANSILTPPPDPGGVDGPDSTNGLAVPDAPGREAPLDLLPGGLDEMLERHRPPVRRRQDADKSEHEALRLWPASPDGLGTPEPGAVDDALGSPMPVAFWEQTPGRLAEERVAPTPVRGAAAVDQAFTGLSIPVGADETPESTEPSKFLSLGREEHVSAGNVAPYVATGLLIEGACMVGGWGIIWGKEKTGFSPSTLQPPRSLRKGDDPPVRNRAGGPSRTS